MSAFIPKLQELLHNGKLIPFIGAGFSEGCACPTGLTLAQKLLRYYELHDLEEDEGVDLLHLTEYLQIIRGGDISELQQVIQLLFNENAVDISKSQAHILLAQLGVPLIYTTNYDHLIERSFASLTIPYQTVVTTQDVINIAGSNITQIVKFHGSFEDPSSIVLTESDYFNRLEFVTPIDMKLRVDALGKSLLFMGYSFSDFNIRYLWFKINNLLKGVTDVPPSYILLSNPDPITAALLRQRGIIAIDLSSYPGLSKTDRLCSFLQQLQ